MDYKTSRERLFYNVEALTQIAEHPCFKALNKEGSQCAMRSRFTVRLPAAQHAPLGKVLMADADLNMLGMRW